MTRKQKSAHVQDGQQVSALNTSSVQEEAASAQAEHMDPGAGCTLFAFYPLFMGYHLF